MFSDTKLNASLDNFTFKSDPFKYFRFPDIQKVYLSTRTGN